jgi:hypothetical protein
VGESYDLSEEKASSIFNTDVSVTYGKWFEGGNIFFKMSETNTRHGLHREPFILQIIFISSHHINLKMEAVYSSETSKTFYTKPN